MIDIKLKDRVIVIDRDDECFGIQGAVKGIKEQLHGSVYFLELDNGESWAYYHKEIIKLSKN